METAPFYPSNPAATILQAQQSKHRNWTCRFFFLIARSSSDMKPQCCLGIDLGAESGRLIAGLWNAKQMRLEEIRRFPNGPIEIAGTLRWDLLRLWAEIQNGLSVAARKYG